MSYRFVLLDADNTLLDFSRSEHEALCDCLNARGIPTHSEIIERYVQINETYWKRLERGEISRQELKISRFEQFFSELNYTFDAETMADDYLAALATKSYLLEGALTFCRHIHGHTRMFIITNGNASVQKGRFFTSPLAPLFENCFISEVVGYEKPHKAFFDAVISSIPNFDPSAAIVIGDSLTSDIQGGINAGLDTCWFNPKRKSPPSHMPITFVAHNFDEVEAIVLS
ncbi:MAG: noncanonical pyrimidine nucleotidase, YjjG family [Ruminococcaceae bacterium]|nr:noncanonical pyrimidine nucleotidase, YjjG family [Oscillospiraceae bacterium]